MEKVKYSLDNQAFSLWPKASENETATDIGWFLYSTKQQDEDRLASLLTTLTNGNIGADLVQMAYLGILGGMFYGPICT
jgi:hypothetical protein